MPAETGAPITDKRALVEFLEAGCKPRKDWRIGTEHEEVRLSHGGFSAARL